MQKLPFEGQRRLPEKVKRTRETTRKATDYAAELEVVPHNLARFLSSQTEMLLMSLGFGPGCDTQFLFSDDILGDYDERPPRHAKAYRRGGGVRDKWGPVSFGRANFAAEHRRLQQERLAAFREYIADVQGGRFPERSHLVEMEAPFLDEVVRAIGDGPSPGES